VSSYKTCPMLMGDAGMQGAASCSGRRCRQLLMSPAVSATAASLPGLVL
jgi:hypothetical protein